MWSVEKKQERQKGEVEGNRRFTRVEDLEVTPKSEHVRSERHKIWNDSPTRTPLTASGPCRRVLPLHRGTAGRGEGWVPVESDTQDAAEAERRRVYYLQRREGNMTLRHASTAED